MERPRWLEHHAECHPRSCGWPGEAFDTDGVPQRAGHGLLSEGGSRVAVHDGAARAGDAREFDLTTCDYGGREAHGAWVLDSILYAAGSSFTGGLGGSEGLCIVSWPGGDGVRVDGATAHADLLDVALAGGPGNSCGSPPGQPLALVNGGTANLIPGAALVRGVDAGARGRPRDLDLPRTPRAAC